MHTLSRTKGLIILFTGNGKGKTTAALGTALRAAGHGMKTCFLQFIKSEEMGYGELKSATLMPALIEIKPLGKGFMRRDKEKKPSQEDIALAREALHTAREKILSGNYDIVVLDEFTYMENYGFIPVDEILSLIAEKPEGLHLVITGRNAHPRLVEKADLITEMSDVKHPLRAGIKAQKGIEF